jgi:hypothetical protein
MEVNGEVVKFNKLTINYLMDWHIIRFLYIDLNHQPYAPNLQP